MESRVKYKCYEIGYAELSEKVTVFKKFLFLNKFLFWKSSFEKVHDLNDYLFWRKSSSQTSLGFPWPTAPILKKIN